MVLATAVAEKLHAYYPSASIDFLLRKGNEALLKGHPFIRRVRVWDKSRKYRQLFRLISDVRSERYDHVINIQRFATMGLLTALSGAKETAGFTKNPFSMFFTRPVKHLLGNPEHPMHETERNQLLISHLTDGRAARPRLYPSDEDLLNTQPYKLKPYVCVAPASVWYTKQYPADKWIEFIDRLPGHMQVFIIGAPSDAALADKILNGCSTAQRVQNLCGKLGLLQSAALQRDAVRNFVNDSAPMHFASAMNAPVTAIYCSTVPSFGYGPLSDKSAVVQTLEPLACKPCGIHGHKACPEGHFKCAYTIRPEQILQGL